MFSLSLRRGPGRGFFGVVFRLCYNVFFFFIFHYYSNLSKYFCRVKKKRMTINFHHNSRGMGVMWWLCAVFLLLISITSCRREAPVRMFSEKEYHYEERLSALSSDSSAYWVGTETGVIRCLNRHLRPVIQPFRIATRLNIRLTSSLHDIEFAGFYYRSIVI